MSQMTDESNASSKRAGEVTLALQGLAQGDESARDRLWECAPRSETVLLSCRLTCGPW